MSARESSKRVPKSIGTGTKLFGSYTLTDLAVGLFPGVVVVLGVQVLVPSGTAVAGYRVRSLTVPLATVGIALGTLGVYLTPTYRSTHEWVISLLRYKRRPSMESHAGATAYTQVERIHPDHDAIERADGTLVGMVQVDPPSMALATDREWHQQATAFQDFLNTTVDFPIQLYATTRPFPAEQYLAHFEDRRSDPDVKNNDQLAALIDHYVDWYVGELDDRQMTIRDHYVVVPVTPREVRFEDESLTQKLAKLPIVGPFIQVWLAPRIEAERAAMLDALDERLRLVARGLRDIDGCGTRRIDAGEATQLVAEFWSGESAAYEDVSKVLRSGPVISSDADRSEPSTDQPPDDGATIGQNRARTAGTTDRRSGRAGAAGDDGSRTPPSTPASGTGGER
jgi:hypothetical protein